MKKFKDNEVQPVITYILKTFSVEKESFLVFQIIDQRSWHKSTYVKDADYIFVEPTKKYGYEPYINVYQYADGKIEGRLNLRKKVKTKSKYDFTPNFSSVRFDVKIAYKILTKALDRWAEEAPDSPFYIKKAMNIAF